MDKTTSSVALLPQEILANITSFFFARDVVRLYLTGDSLLIKKLHQGGVRHFSTSNWIVTAPSLSYTEIMPPNFINFLERRSVHGSLARFTQLSHISICYQDNQLIIAPPSIEHLTVFGKTLVSLDIRMMDAFRALLRTEYHKILINSRSKVYWYPSSCDATLFIHSLLQKIGKEDEERLNSSASPYPLSKLTNPWLNFAELTPNLRSFTVVATVARYTIGVVGKDIVPFAALLITSLPPSLQELECNLVSGTPPEILYAILGQDLHDEANSKLNNHPGLPLLHTLVFHGKRTAMFEAKNEESHLTLELAKLLPSSLTSLYIPMRITPDALAILSHIRVLQLQQLSLGAVKALPPQLEHLVAEISKDVTASPDPLSLFPRSLKTLRIRHEDCIPINAIRHIPPGLTNLSMQGVTYPTSSDSIDSILLAHIPLGMRTLDILVMPWNRLVSLNCLPSTLESLTMPHIGKFEKSDFKKFPFLTRLTCQHSTITEEAIIYAPSRVRLLSFGKMEAQGFAMTRFPPINKKPDLTRNDLQNSTSAWLERDDMKTSELNIQISYFTSQDLLECPPWITSICKSLNCSKIPPAKLPPLLTYLPTPYRLKLEEIHQLPILLAHLKEPTIEVSVESALRLAAFVPPETTCYVHPKTLSQYLHLMPEYQIERNIEAPLMVSPICETPMTPQLMMSLPSKLQKLSFVDENMLSHEIIAAIPDTVTSMTIRGNADSIILLDNFAAGRLQTLLALSMSTPSKYGLTSIEKLMYPSQESPKNGTQSALGFAVLPRGLTSLTMGTYKDEFLTLPMDAWRDLPDGLKILHINFPILFRNKDAINLPRNITDLRIETSSLDIKCFDDLPPNLQVISLARATPVRPFRKRILKRMSEPNKAREDLKNDK